MGEGGFQVGSIKTYQRGRFKVPTFLGGQCPSDILVFKASSKDELMNSSKVPKVTAAERSAVGRQIVRPGRRLSCGSFEETSTNSNSRVDFVKRII